MLDTYIIDIGVYQEEDESMRIFSSVILHDAEGTSHDDWICDYDLLRIGDGGGTWTFMRSQGNLLLWGRGLEFQARFKDFSPNSGRRGTVELAKPLNGSRALSYTVRRTS